MRRAGLLLSALVLAACGDGHTYLAITVTSTQPLTLARLAVTLDNAGMTGHAEVAPSGGITLPPDQSFAVQLDGRSGEVKVHLDAIAGNGATVASADDTTTLEAGGTARLTLRLGAVAGDGGTDGAPDLAGSCTDNVKNGTETDIDCGGTCPNKCAETKGCGIADDCQSAYCNTTSGKCGPARCLDQVMDGDETDIDCGGASCGPCARDKHCAMDGDCTTRLCAATFCSVVSGPPSWVTVPGTLPQGIQYVAGTGAASADGKLVGETFVVNIATGNHQYLVAYDTATNTFSSTTYPELPQQGGVAIAFGSNGTLYALGGGSDTSPIVNTYALMNGTWTAAVNEITAHNGQVAVLGPDGFIYVLGGVSTTSMGGDVYAYSGTSMSSQTSMIHPRKGPSAATTAGRVYAIGSGDAPNTAEAYNPVTMKWTATANMNASRSGSCAATGADGRVYALSGTDGNVALTSVEAYAPGADHWFPTAGLPGPRGLCVAGLGVDGRLYAMGGAYTDNTGNHYVADVVAYGPILHVPATATPGSTVAVTGDNFGALANVALFIGNATTPAATAKTDSKGVFTAPAMVPLPAGSTGAVQIRAVDDRSEYPVHATVTVM